MVGVAVLKFFTHGYVSFVLDLEGDFKNILVVYLNLIMFGCKLNFQNNMNPPNWSKIYYQWKWILVFKVTALSAQ